MSKTFEYPVTILEKHLDTFAHVNNATYLEIYEEARWDFIEKNGYGYSVIHEKKMGPVILGINISFKKELINREKINIVSQMAIMKSKMVMEISQQMIKEDGSVASEITLSIGFMDFKKRKLIEPISEWMTAVGLGS